MKFCDESIFFTGPLLEAVQMATIYEDSKTFVDKKLKFPPGKIIKNFETLLNQHNGSLLSVEEIKKVGMRKLISWAFKSCLKKRKKEKKKLYCYLERSIIGICKDISEFD